MAPKSTDILPKSTAVLYDKEEDPMYPEPTAIKRNPIVFSSSGTTASGSTLWKPQEVTLSDDSIDRIAQRLLELLIEKRGNDVKAKMDEL